MIAPSVYEMEISMSGFFAFSENLDFCDHKNRNLTEKFEPAEVPDIPDIASPIFRHINTVKTMSSFG